MKFYLFSTRSVLAVNLKLLVGSDIIMLESWLNSAEIQFEFQGADCSVEVSITSKLLGETSFEPFNFTMIELHILLTGFKTYLQPP